MHASSLAIYNSSAPSFDKDQDLLLFHLVENSLGSSQQFAFGKRSCPTRTCLSSTCPKPALKTGGLQLLSQVAAVVWNEADSVKHSRCDVSFVTIGLHFQKSPLWRTLSVFHPFNVGYRQKRKIICYRKRIH